MISNFLENVDAMMDFGKTKANVIHAILAVLHVLMEGKVPAIVNINLFDF